MKHLAHLLRSCTVSHPGRQLVPMVRNRVGLQLGAKNQLDPIIFQRGKLFTGLAGPLHCIPPACDDMGLRSNCESRRGSEGTSSLVGTRTCGSLGTSRSSSSGLCARHLAAMILHCCAAGYASGTAGECWSLAGLFARSSGLGSSQCCYYLEPFLSLEPECCTISA